MEAKSYRLKRVRRYDNVYTLLRKLFKIPDNEMIFNFYWDKDSNELVLETVLDDSQQDTNSFSNEHSFHKPADTSDIQTNCPLGKTTEDFDRPKSQENDKIGDLHGEFGAQNDKKSKVTILDNNPLSIASYLEDHPEVAEKLDTAEKIERKKRGKTKRYSLNYDKIYGKR